MLFNGKLDRTNTASVFLLELSDRRWNEILNEKIYTQTHTKSKTIKQFSLLQTHVTTHSDIHLIEGHNDTLLQHHTTTSHVTRQFADLGTDSTCLNNPSDDSMVTGNYWTIWTHHTHTHTHTHIHTYIHIHIHIQA